MTTATERTKVIFRKWKDNGVIIAFFPELAADTSGQHCNAYEHIGQHGGADYFRCLDATQPATEAEAKDLIAELTGIGYALHIVKRYTRRMLGSCQVSAKGE